ncbi:histone-like nucleoid-structuring protein Lsr2 [Actinomadura sp. HBU206391]|uniref:Lsr2 family DNA-binding protein n=1 Tax=Actinomadura sp. HBU206391 TaxID=2731692 RepID=UPI0016505E3C|nr:histone-like nucleoid-structuring protein Lsr2 [Actinomadura sp. HBU206391]MBC6456605.1 Lsr2 family protein [Actinomadura sp. HBU206391]
MTDEVAIPPWERLQRLSEKSVHEQHAQAARWADELMSRHGMDVTPRYIWAAQRDTIAAVLVSLVDGQASVSDHGGIGVDRSDSDASEVSDAPRYNDRSNDVSPSMIRAWAQQNGISISGRGRIPMWVIKRYQTQGTTNDSEKALARKIRAALEQYGELTKSELWDIVGRNQHSWKIENALKLLPEVQTLKGESSGGRPPVIFRLVKEELDQTGESTGTTASSQLTPRSLGTLEDAPALSDGSSDLDTGDSKIHDFLEILRGESRSG